MNNTANLTDDLRQLQDLYDLSSRTKAAGATLDDLEKQIGDLREGIPTSILTHFDNKRSRGKRGIASVRNGVCGACHLRIPKGYLTALTNTDTVNICVNCGSFIYLDETSAPAPEPKKAPAKKAAKKS